MAEFPPGDGDDGVVTLRMRLFVYPWRRAWGKVTDYVGPGPRLGRFYDEMWTPCRRCEKIVQVNTRARRREHIDMWRKQMERGTYCLSCTSDMHIKRDECPECILFEDVAGFGMCGKRWHHAGRCEPMFPPEDVEAAWERANPTK